MCWFIKALKHFYFFTQTWKLSNFSPSKKWIGVFFYLHSIIFYTSICTFTWVQNMFTCQRLIAVDVQWSHRDRQAHTTAACRCSGSTGVTLDLAGTPPCTQRRPAVLACPCLPLLPQPDLKGRRQVWRRPRRAADDHDRLRWAGEWASQKAAKRRTERRDGGVSNVTQRSSPRQLYSHAGRLEWGRPRQALLVEEGAGDSGGGSVAPLTLHLSSFFFTQFRHSVNIPPNLKVFLF